ncbi:MAG: hypothetical protein HOQ22_18350, partial [Nocardioidaceae bacterium]|nr:hypothetical protein [Nocardioidaceae bacterium]
MTAARRWACVVLGVLLLVVTPVLLRAVPVSDARLSAPALLQRVEQARDRGYSGYVETVGAVGLPENAQLSGLTALVGDTNRLRVWWRDPGTWRVATLRTTGETDLFHARHRTLRWEYESKDVTVVPDVPVRLPFTSDLLPPEL